MAVFPTALAAVQRNLARRKLEILAGFCIVSLAPFASADIVNTVRVTGQPVRGELKPDQDTAFVPVEELVGRLVVSYEPGGITRDKGSDPERTDGGDYLWYRLLLKNVGNAPVTNVSPKVPMPNFGGNSGTGTPPRIVFDPENSTAPSPNMVGPGETLVFVVSYVFTEIDVLRGAQHPQGLEVNPPLQDNYDECECAPDYHTIPADPKLIVTNRVALGERYGNIGDGRAAIGDIIRYTYTVENTGNVAIKNVVLNNIHEEGEGHSLSLSSIAHMHNEGLVRDGPLGNEAPSRDSVQDGKWDLLQPGAVIRFTYSRTVSEAEFHAQ